ncbi:nucleotidyl transferase AbiEii/AbiGii toxin family protein [Arcanobacterium phocae]|uniref:nucleotidyl transferase AbiEii/AbiGii toxin family protein n=1 Tax=Arcanobacterium phocae TaxID=131112 RepID=UPI001C0F1C59|nr:nucleotidyl transferase AbiEii/AbiGii toxin family protein [Arcanobacterium phocae]
MSYKTPSALEQAVKSAASAAPLNTGRAISAFYFHRFLCRVFANGNNSFVLKGGHAMLARTINARMTRDIDLLASGTNLDTALEELRGLIEIDLGDFVTFEFVGAVPIKTDDKYRSGLAVKFTPMIGSKRMQQISVDLVVDTVPLEETERISPADRIDVKGLEVYDYLIYPVENAVADKLCALIETHDGRSSSRVKDLVDIIIYATTSPIDGTKLQKRVHHEATVRSITLPTTFHLPSDWDAPHERQFKKLCANTGLPEDLRNMNAASSLAGSLVNPAINSTATGLHWDSSMLKWE